MPVVFWDKKLKELKLYTKVSEVDDDCVSLLPEYLEWKK
jgi:HSP90 family molecular chaperone